MTGREPSWACDLDVDIPDEFSGRKGWPSRLGCEPGRMYDGMGACPGSLWTGFGANSYSSMSSEKVPAPPYVVLPGTTGLLGFFFFGGAACVVRPFRLVKHSLRRSAFLSLSPKNRT